MDKIEDFVVLYLLVSSTEVIEGYGHVRSKARGKEILLYHFIVTLD